MNKYDVLIVGSGPGGEKAAVQASKLGKRVAVIERKPFIGGAGLHTGTLPSKTLREAALFLAAFKQRAVFGFQCTLGKEVKLDELMHRKSEVIRRQMEVIVDHFSRNDIEIIYGEASFVDEHTLKVKKIDGGSDDYSGEVIILAPGTSPHRPDNVPFDKDNIFDSDTILELTDIPKTLTIIGGGVIGCEYACIFSALGVKVTVVEKRPEILSFADAEIVNNLLYWMRQEGITVKLGEEVVGIEIAESGRVETKLKSGKIVATDKLLYTMGRLGNAGSLNLGAVNIEANDRGLLKVNDKFQTNVKHIYAVGDIIGFPSLASTSREQGRRAICHAFAGPTDSCAVMGLLPYGVYTIPEISMVGKTEETLTEEQVPYEVGTVNFAEVARGQIAGELYGMLKIVFHRESLAILGVHIIGDKASELIHIGQTAMSFGATIEYFRDTVFNYPTLSDAYKQAAHNGLNRL